MARYEFECPTCGRQVEVTRPMSEYDLPLYCDGVDTDTETPKHEVVQMGRIVSRFSAQVRGGTRYSSGPS